MGTTAHEGLLMWEVRFIGRSSSSAEEA
jgi:hypothetical protein